MQLAKRLGKNEDDIFELKHVENMHMSQTPLTNFEIDEDLIDDPLMSEYPDVSQFSFKHDKLCEFFNVDIKVPKV